MKTWEAEKAPYLLSKCKRVKTSLSKRVKICKTTLKKVECGFSFTKPLQKEWNFL